MWKARFEILFRRHYRRLEPHLKRKVKEAIREIVSSEDPADLGEQKRGHLRHFYAYDLGRQYRIIYYISYTTRRVIFIDVGSHKQVYGKD